jgi:hypothetical protein
VAFFFSGNVANTQLHLVLELPKQAMRYDVTLRYFRFSGGKAISSTYLCVWVLVGAVVRASMPVRALV